MKVLNSYSGYSDKYKITKSHNLDSMVLKKCKDQNHCSFIGFFNENDLNTSGLLQNRMTSNGNLIKYLENRSDNIILFGFTSHERICIVDGENTSEGWFLTINSTGYNENYDLQFLLPEAILGWKNALTQVSDIEKSEVYTKIIEAIQFRHTNRVN